MKNTVYGYCRISTMKQKLQRQIDNIKREYPEAVIITEEYTGTTVDRPNWNKLYKRLKSGDTVVFDEVSRMSRNADEGFKLYEDLFNRGVKLIFLKEPYINSDVYQGRLNAQVERIQIETGSKAIDKYFTGQFDLLRDLMIDTAREQIEIAFQTAQQEVDYLHQRTSEGVRKAQASGKQVGRASGTKVETKRAKEAKEVIRKHSKDFNGTLTDIEVMKLTGLARNTYYKYKREMK